MYKKFTIDCIISVATGILMPSCAREGFDQLYQILNYMCDDDFMTHQLPRAADEVKPYLFEQFPWLNDVDMNYITENAERCQEIVDVLTAKHGATHEVIPMHQEDHQRIDAMDEAAMIFPKDKIIGIDLGNDEIDDIGTLP